ncbi:sensor histidine kinase [Herbaspirillum sp. alder98]|uniref:sensor histidine kinase n=1 Tax=Herbaspirillum sp. alder98 TaxID=2913096 RepID=UPI001CD8B402|nr:HAMP domain-containing sensor histidine kinase [Herbaspirillum sp. alder98]
MPPLTQPSTAEKMRALSSQVFSEWQTRVRSQVKQAAALSEPILTDSLPTLYRGISDAIEANSLSAYIGLTRSVGAEHGNERARITAYNVAALIKEYQLLRTVIVDVLETHEVVLSNAEGRIFNGMIDLSISEAANGFAMVQAVFRERFVATVAHDLRNPLSACHIAAQMIGRATDPEHIRTLAARIESNSLRMNRMIEDLLDNVVFEAGERLHLELIEFDMQDLVHEVIQQASEIHDNRFVYIGESIKGCWGFEPIRRALENLIGNAVKYGDRDSPITITLSDGRGRARLTVHNEGPVIPVADIESIFKVFERAGQGKDQSTIGWGLGLPYVRNVAESHGGSISAESSAEKGTSFAIDVPADARPFVSTPVL